VLSDLPTPPDQPASPPIIQVEREARALLADLAATGELLPAAPTIYGRPVLHAIAALPPAPEPAPEPEPAEAKR